MQRYHSWIYCTTTFNVVNHPIFQVMIKYIGQYDIGLKAPTFHDVQVLLLKERLMM